MITVLLFSLLGMVLFMLVLWGVQYVKGEADIVDLGWASGLGFLALTYAFLGEGNLQRRIVVAAMAVCWAGRLSHYLFMHRFLQRGEDARYAALRASWGQSAQMKFFIFFQAQAILASILSLPFALSTWNSAPAFSIFELIGGMLWVGAFLGEYISDQQLLSFRADVTNRGTTCRQGLWRYSRHPNYFFDWLQWVAFALIASAASWGWLAFSAPLIMLYLFLKVTGIPPTEARALASRGEEYREYQRATSAFVPWFPRKITK